MNSSGKALLDVLNRVPNGRRPVWFMRQAGRYLPEYRELRADAGSFLDLCYNPEMAAEVTVQPIRRFDIDAAILFSDILVIPQAMGCDLGFVQNEGPKLSTVGNLAEVEALSCDKVVEFLQPVFETIKFVKPQLPGHVAFIGFCGAPWTVATYMIEGGTSSDRLTSKRAAFGREPWFDMLIDKLVDASIDYLVAQVNAGVEVLQIFDSWASDLPDLERDRYCYKPIAKIIKGIRARGVTVPVIGFAKGLGAGQKDFCKNVELQAVGLESTLSVDWISKNLVPEMVVQGNLDPILLDIGGEGLERSVEHIVSGLPKDRHIFNLGHGIRQTTEIDHVQRMIDAVRKHD
jgi:uroporphyrinogen decarboxylase